MRALPLRVWKARLTVVKATWSSCRLCRSASAAWAVASTSRASSRKTSRISGSSSRPLETVDAGAKPAASVTTGKCWVASPAVACGAASAWCTPAWVVDIASAPSPSIGRPWVPSCAAARCATRDRWTMRSNSSVTARASVSRGASSSSGMAVSIASKPVGRSSRAITAASEPVSGLKRNSDLAICGCTLTMSIRKLSAPRLSARRSKVPVWIACWGLTSVLDKASTSSRMRSTACEAWSRPSTDNTPRIADSCAGTGISTSRWVGLRKYWSMFFSTSDSEARNSCTTLPMVCRSETRR